MSEPSEILSVALRVAAAIEQVGGRYFVGGSFASSVDGEPRATNDIDFVIDLPLVRISALAVALGDDFEVDQDMLRDAVLHGRSANAFYLPLVLKIDFFGHAHGPFDDAEFARRRSVEMHDGAALFVKSPEDSILRKLLWYREGNEVSDKQWRDVLGVLLGQRDRLDREYLSSWAGRLGVDDLLERAFDAAG